MSGRRVITRAVLDLKTNVWVKEESHAYDGPWSYAGQPGDFNAEAYRLYEEGTQSGATPMEEQDTQTDVDVDTNFQIRIRVNEAFQAADTLEGGYWEYNLAAAGWLTLTTTSSVIKAVTTTGFADADDTTERLNGGGVVFVTPNSWASETGVMPDLAFAQNDYAEALVSVQIIGDDVSNGQNLLVRFQSVTPATASTKDVDMIIVKAGGGARRRSNIT